MPTLEFAPLFWWGLPLAAAPVLIHLINLLRQRRVKWAAMEFLLASQQRSRRCWTCRVCCGGGRLRRAWLLCHWRGGGISCRFGQGWGQRGFTPVCCCLPPLHWLGGSRCSRGCH